MSSGEFAAFVAELSSPDEVALLKGATLDEVLAIAAVRESERCIALIAEEEMETAPTLRPVVEPSDFASDRLADSARGTLEPTFSQGR